MSDKLMLIITTQDTVDAGVLIKLKPHLGDMRTKVLRTCPEYLVIVDKLCTDIGATCIFSDSEDFLQKFLGNPKAKLDSYAGSHYYHKLRNGREIEVVFSNPLAHIHTVSYGEFLIKRWVSKLVTPTKWFPTPSFAWKEITPVSFKECMADMDSSFVAAVDIETKRAYLQIDMASVTTVHIANGKYTTKSWVILLRTMADFVRLREMCAHPVAKVLQNGKYDALYLARWESPLQNYIWDTKLLQFCWYAELPKDLAFLQAMYVRTASYWKDLSESNDERVRMEYNARDTWATACAFLAIMFEAPDFVHKNYSMKLPAFPASHYCELLGIKRDEEVQKAEAEDAEKEIDSTVSHLRKCLGSEHFNVNSHIQVKNLLKVLGCPDTTSSDEKHLNKAAFLHPFNKYLLDQVLHIRGLRKLHSTYFPMEKNYNGRVLYSLNPDGTDTGRNASKESAFWCGLQIQNVPPNAKHSFVADDDFYIAECDLEQAESRGTGYFTGDENLIAAVESGKDFHSLNASAFFGYKYEQIFDVEAGKPRMKPLRTLSKRVNHGANYNMGVFVLIDTMGLEAIWEAKRLLNLNCTTAEQVAQYLLDRFDATYPIVRGAYHDWIKYTVASTGMLVGPQGWTRICFGDPRKSKPVLNSYVAHSPQSLNAMSVDEAFIEVFRQIQLHPQHSKNFRLLAQIHDSIFFQYRKGHEYLCEMVRLIMERPITCTDISGVTRTFLVPAALKLGVKDKTTGELIRATSWATTE